MASFKEDALSRQCLDVSIVTWPNDGSDFDNFLLSPSVVRLSLNYHCLWWGTS